MTRGIKFAGIVIVLATACSAEEGLKVQNNGKQKWPAAEAQKIYLSACSAVQGEFGGSRLGGLGTSEMRVKEALATYSKDWRKRMGVEPIGDTVRCHPPVLKTGTITGLHALPCSFILNNL
jgi:hypothetical protein